MEINTFEQKHAIFEGIQKKLIAKFYSIAMCLESELASVENAMKGAFLLSRTQWKVRFYCDIFSPFTREKVYYSIFNYDLSKKL